MDNDEKTPRDTRVNPWRDWERYISKPGRLNLDDDGDDYRMRQKEQAIRSTEFEGYQSMGYFINGKR